MIRKLQRTSSDLFNTVGTIHSPDVMARGVFSKGRSKVLDKIILFPVTRYFLFKFQIFCFKFGKFLLGGFVSFLNYFNLLVDENEALSKDIVALNRRKSAKSGLK